MNRSFYYMNITRRGKLYRFFLLLTALSSLFFLTGVLNTLSLCRTAQESLSEMCIRDRYYQVKAQKEAAEADLRLAVDEYRWMLKGVS